MSDIINFEDDYLGNGSGHKLVEPMRMEIAMQYTQNDYDETILSYVNNIRTKDGGTHETGFRTGLTRAVNDFAAENGLLKNKMKLEGSDIRRRVNRHYISTYS